IEIFRPRTFSISRSLFLSRSSPSKRISPATISPGGEGTRRRIEREVTLLPQPVSPTIPKVSLSESENDRSWTAGKVPRLRWKLTERFLTSRRGVFICEMSVSLRLIHHQDRRIQSFVLVCLTIFSACANFLAGLTRSR